TAVAREVADEILQPMHEAYAAGVDELLQRRGIACQRVGRRHRVYDQRDDEARPFGIALVELDLVQETVECVAPGEVALRQRAASQVLFPGRIGKALVLGIGCRLAAAGRDAPEFTEERQIVAAGYGGIAQYLRDQQTRRSENVLAAHPDQRGGRQRVL